MVIAQALLFEDGLIIVEVADEQVEFDKFCFHKTILSTHRSSAFLLLIRIVYIKTWLEYFFIKIFAYKKRYHLLCDICSRGIELEGQQIDTAKKLNGATLAYLNKSISTEQYEAVLNEVRSDLGIALEYLPK